MQYGRWSAIKALLVQALICALAGCATALSGLFLEGRLLAIVHFGGQWIAWPAVAAYASYRCVRRGLPAILSWALAPIACAGAYWAIVGLPPSAGATALTAVIALVGAAAGEVRKNRRKNG